MKGAFLRGTEELLRGKERRTIQDGEGGRRRGQF